MKKLIELGVAIDIAIGAADEYDGGYNFERDRKIRDALMALPTVDAIRVVRCKDCRFSNMTVNGECKYCDIWFPDEAEYMDGDYYCASGERKDGDADGV